MKGLFKIVFALFAGALGVAAGSCVALVLTVHLIQGKSSPGILAVAAVSLRYWIPLIFFLSMCWAAIVAARIVWLAKQRAAGADLTVSQYFDLTQSERESLAVRQHRS